MLNSVETAHAVNAAMKSEQKHRTTPKKATGSSKGLVDTGVHDANRRSTRMTASALSKEQASRIRLLTGSGVILGTTALGMAKMARKENNYNNDTGVADEELWGEFKYDSMKDGAQTMEEPGSGTSFDAVDRSDQQDPILEGDNSHTPAALDELKMSTPSPSTLSFEEASMAADDLTREPSNSSIPYQESDTDVPIAGIATMSTIEMENTVEKDKTAREETIAKLLQNVKDEQDDLPSALQILLKREKDGKVDGAGPTETSTESNANRDDQDDTKFVISQHDATPNTDSSNSTGDSYAAPEAIVADVPIRLTSFTSKTSSLSVAKDKLSQFFFVTVKRDETAAQRDVRRSSLIDLDPNIKVTAAIAKARQQPKSATEESRLQAKYAAIDTLEERAYTILVDLGMVTVSSCAPGISSVSVSSAGTADKSEVEMEWA